MNNDLVSIITPAYKAARFIRETVASVQAQSYQDWEMLITEDCGPDDTRDIVRTLAAGDPRVRLIQPNANGGPAAARNHSLDAASGRWIAFLDSDDLWLPRKLEHQLAFHRKNPGAMISFTGFRRITADGARTGHYIAVPRRLAYRDLLGRTVIATSTVIVDKAASGTFAMKSTYYDDFACWLELLRGGGHAIGLNEDLMRYRVLDASVSRNKTNSAKQVWNTLRRVENLSPVSSLWHFGRYAAYAALKYRKF